MTDTEHVCRPGSLYFCPTAAEVESSCHGRFDVCCDAPGLHVPLPDGPGVDALSRALSEAAEREYALETKLQAILEATVVWRDRPGGDVGLAIALAGILDADQPEPPASAALVRVLRECDRIERAVRANPQDPDFDGAYLAAIGHIRNAADGTGEAS